MKYDIGERKYRKKDRTLVTVEVSGNIISYSGKKALCIVSRDVTAWKEAKEKLANERYLLRTLIDNIPDAIWIKDTKGKFLISNKATARDIGVKSPENIIGKTDFDFLPKDTAKELFSDEQKIVYSGKPQLYKEVPSKDGQKWGLNTKVPLRDNKNQIIGLVGINRDIAKQKNTEIELKKYKDQLEELVEERTKELKLINKRLKNEVSERKKAESELKYRFEFEQLIKNLSSRFINLNPEDIDTGINQALKAIGEFLKVDRSYVFLFHDYGTKMSNTHEWCAKGIKSQIENLKNLPVDIFPWWMQKLNRLENIYIPSVSDLSVEANTERELLQMQKIKSVVGVPMVYFGKTLVGFIGFDSVRREKEWSDDNISLVKLTGELFVTALERKKAGETLHYSQEMLQHVLDNIPQRIFWKDINSVYRGCNRVFAEAAGGREPEDIIGRTDYDLRWSKEKADYFTASDKCVIESDLPEYHSIESQTSTDGNQIWLDISKIPLHDGEGNVIGVLGTSVDMTDRIRSEQELEESEERFRQLAALLPEVVFEMDKSGKLIFINRKAYKILGFTPDEFEKGLSFNKLLAPECRKSAREIAKKLMNEEEVEIPEYTAQRKDGTTFPVLIRFTTIYRDGKVFGLRGILFNITERKKGENITTALYSISKAVHSTISLEDLFKTIHNALSTIIDTTNFYIASYIKENDIIEFTYWQDQKDDFPVITNAKESGSLTAEVINKKKPLLIYENDLNNKFSKKELKQWGAIPKVWLGVPLKIKDSVIGVMTVQSYVDPNLYSKKDIKLLESVSEQVAVAIDRKRSEEALRESEEKYRMFIEQSNDAIYILHGKKFLLINKKFEEIFGVTLEEVNNPDFDFINLVAPSSRPLIEERSRRLQRGEKLEPKYEFTALDKNGKDIEVETSVSYIKYKNLYATQGILRDLTERKKTEEEKKKLEEQLFQAHKMESMGRLAGGVAHDFINMLSIIKGHAQLLEIRYSGKAKTRDKTVEIIISEIEKATELTRKLLDFARGSDFYPEPVNINSIMKNTLLILDKILGINIKLKFQFEKNVYIVEADKNQIEQVLTNIVINARDAMPEGGDLIIKTENVSIKTGNDFLPPEFRPGKYVKISIKDTGVGMQKNIEDRIFEPFFTTKEKGKGTGLGLAAVYGIIKLHRGFIYCNSKRDEGTTFNIYLPKS
ncbi:PAS domain S-box protein [candidate division KSB1 bacterium]